MKVTIILVGKTTRQIQELINEYEKRLRPYVEIDWKVIKEEKNDKIRDLIKTESRNILNMIKEAKEIVLLEDKGKQLSSLEFAEFINHNRLNNKRLLFIIGGAHGVADEIKQRSGFLLSLSRMTFTHQMVRLIFVEQLYRAFMILSNKKYHH